MTSRTALFLLMALVFGAAAVLLARQWLQSQRTATGLSTENVATTTVVIAAKDLAFGTRITGDDVKEVRWPADAVPQGAFPSKEKLLASGPVVVRRFATNEPI